MTWWRYWSQPARVERLRRRAERLRRRSDWRGALVCLQRAETLDANDPTLYADLIAVHQQLSHEWADEDCVRSLQWEMRRQELLDPSVAVQHVRLAPEWQQVIDLANRWLFSADADEQQQLLLSIRAYGVDAVVPLLDLLRQRATPSP